MAVHIRLRRIGKNPKKRPHFRLTVFEETRSRDGRIIEELGYYNPVTGAATITNNSDTLLRMLVLRLDQNIFSANVPRGVQVGEITEGMKITKMVVNGSSVNLTTPFVASQLELVARHRLAGLAPVEHGDRGSAPQQ